MKNEYTIYLIQNVINNKKYIGQTRQILKLRFYQHCYDKRNNMVICKAIRKYGKENFNIWVLDYTDCQICANKLEGFYIKYFNTLDKRFGYNTINIDLNGNYKMSEETKLKISQKSSREKHKDIFRKLARQQRGVAIKSKFVNVYKNGKTFQTGISLNTKYLYLGKYYTKEEAENYAILFLQEYGYKLI